MDNVVLEKLKEQDVKLEAIWKSVEKTRKYFLVILWATVILFALPALGLVYAIPKFLDVYTGLLGGF